VSITLPISEEQCDNLLVNVFGDALIASFDPMEERLLRELANEFLVPFFSGSSIEDAAQISTYRDKRVAFRNPVSIALKVSTKDKYRLVLTRSQPFAGKVIPETRVVSAFVDALSEMEDALNTPLKLDLLSTFERKIVAKAVAARRDWSEVVLFGIDQLAKWGNRLYEGAPISAAIGFRHRSQPEVSLRLSELAAHDFTAVLTNGQDTLLEFDFAGRLIQHRALSAGNELPSYCPFRQAPIAEWTTTDERRIALTLNRLGEILVFRNQQLLFARRSGRWRFLTHEPVITQMGVPRDPNIRRAIYETCLDASFARTGACIGIVTRPGIEEVVQDEDRVQNGDGPSTKVRTIRSIIQGQSFQNLDRRLRQELVAVDGATVLSNEGDILAAGAILKIPGGSSGGGRLAAAKALGHLGLGIKVSQDGAITGFRLERADPAFNVM
jgi:hypothetical protein